MPPSPRYHESVFINCPFDPAYAALFDTIVFAVHDCGYVARSALELQDRLMPLHKALFIEPGVSGAKYALSRLGRIENVVRSPLVTVEESTAKAIESAMKHAGLIN